MTPEPKAFRENHLNLKDRPQRLGLIRQLDNFSCGPASVFALWEVLNYFLYHQRKKEHLDCAHSIQDLVSKICAPVVDSGTSNEDIARAMLACNIPLSSHDECAWSGDLAIANIRNMESGVGHYVLFLKKEGGVITFFDPILSEIISAHRSDIDWRSSNGELAGWSANTGIYLSDMDMLKIYVKPVNFIITEIDSKINTIYDVSTAIFQKLNKMNKQVVWRTREHLRTKGTTLFVDSIRVRKNDIVWIRLDPESTPAYYETLRLLCHVDGIFVNSPSSILLYHDKFTALHFKYTPTYSATSRAQFIKVINELKYKATTRVVIKSTGNCGGKDVYFINTNDDPSLAFSLIDKYGLVIIEPYIDKPAASKNNQDVRFLWIRNQGFIGSVLRESDGENALCNLTAGGIAKLPVSTMMRRETLHAMDAYLQGLSGVFIAGVDWMNDKDITEINISCPSVFVDFEKLTDIDIISMVIDATQSA